MNTYEIYSALDNANMALLSRVRVLQEAQDEGKTGLDEEEKKFSDIQKKVFLILQQVSQIMLNE